MRTPYPTIVDTICLFFLHLMSVGALTAADGDFSFYSFYGRVFKLRP